MKTMTCKQLGGACEIKFHAETFEDMASQSHQHGTKMFEQQDTAHLEAMEQMKELMSKEGAFDKWMAERKAEFDALQED